MYHDQMHKKHQGTKLSLQQEVSHFVSKFPFHPLFWSIWKPHTLMNSSYRLNTTNFQFTQYHPQTFNMKLSKAFAYIKHGGCHGVCVHFHHKVSTPYNFNIQFPMYSKFITHVYDVTMNTSMHQYCVIFIAPPTGHRNSDKYPIYMTCIGFSYHILQDDM